MFSAFFNWYLYGLDVVIYATPDSQLSVGTDTDTDTDTREWAMQGFLWSFQAIFFCF